MRGFSKHNKKHYELIKRITEEEKGIDMRVVHYITSHSFRFASRVMADKNDDRPIRFRYLGVWSRLKGREKE